MKIPRLKKIQNPDDKNPETEKILNPRDKNPETKKNPESRGFTWILWDFQKILRAKKPLIPKIPGIGIRDPAKPPSRSQLWLGLTSCHPSHFSSGRIKRSYRSREVTISHAMKIF